MTPFDELTAATTRVATVDQSFPSEAAREWTLATLGLAVVILAVRRLRKAVARADLAEMQTVERVLILERRTEELGRLYHDMHVEFRVCDAERRAQAAQIAELLSRLGDKE